jgi:PAS domain S-box-containing protein
MTFEELIRTFAEHLTTAIVVTDAALKQPGPVIRYVNPAFCRLTGYAAEELVGDNPRQLQGPATQPMVIRTLSRALQERRRFHGVVSNYRKSGEHYLCEIDIRPIVGVGGGVESFVAFEREVVRPRGRPRRGDELSRYKAVLPDDPVFAPSIAGLSPFAP